MPRVSEFYGIVIGMFYDEHPPPHFHAIYAGQRAQIGIDPIVILKGRLPRNAFNLVRDWAAEHQDELRDNWNRCERHLPLARIEPLE